MLKKPTLKTLKRHLLRNSFFIFKHFTQGTQKTCLNCHRVLYILKCTEKTKR